MNKSITELRNIHKGQDIWIIGAGSSMDYVDSSFFDNKICISVNQMYQYFPCEYVVGRDLNVRVRWDDTVKDLSKRKGVKFLYSRLHQGYGVVNPIIESDNFYEFESGISDDVKGLDCIGTDSMVAIRTTLNTCINIAGYMGAKNIILCGHDGGGIDGKMYYHEYVEKDWESASNWDGIKGFLNNMERETIAIKQLLKMKERLTGIFTIMVM